ncbi:MAG: hypothetical protein AABO57_08435 [Acidobacteriota bacterium]
MRLSLRLALLLVLLSICATPSSRAQTPTELLLGKWRLRGGNRLIASLEIKVNGYSYAVLPNYRETGRIILYPSNPTWIDLSIATGPNKGKTTMGIFSIKNSRLQLCLGKLGGQRPAELKSDPKQEVILWEGSKTQ